jgi:uncharacterized protein (DUF1501 family)
MTNRRFFLKSSAIAAAGIGMIPSFLARAAVQNSNSRKNKILITIFQRGAADGLNMIIPFGEPAYSQVRPSLAIAAPKGSPASQAASGRAIDLDGFFAMHPLMAPLKPIYDQHHLAVVHAAGLPDNTRSHFDAQDFMESGTPGVKTTNDGWLNRHLVSKPDSRATLFRAVALGSALPPILRGKARAIALSSIQEFQIAAAEQDFRAMYQGNSYDLIYGTGKDTMTAVAALRKINPLQYQPRAGAEYPDTVLGRSLRQIAQLIKANVGLEVAFADSDGWDTHANQAGQFDSMLTDLSQSIGALHKDLDNRMEDVVILTFSEFGRTAAENGNRGTDHGHANVMMLLGGPVMGGKVYGKWPGLAKEQLYEGRDLALTTDFRLVFGEVLGSHLGNKVLDAVFPGYAMEAKNFHGVIAI